MTAPLDDLDLDVLAPFSLLFAPSSADSQSMPIVKGESHPTLAYAMMPVAALQLHGRWTGHARLRIFLIPESGGVEQELVDIPASTSSVAIPPIQAAATGEGAMLRGYVSNHLATFNPAAAQLILSVIPMPYS